MIGAGSRRACDDIIKEGRVTVDGHRVTEPGTRVSLRDSTVTLDKVPVSRPPRPIVLLLNKPTGVVTTVSDPQGRPTVIDLCKPFTRRTRLFPVGRLDINTSGLILLTNDGELCYRLTHPSFEIPRTYQVRVRGSIDDKKINALRRLASSRPREDNRFAVQLVKQMGRESVLRVTLHEGRNRQIRKMCQTLGLGVTMLRRVKFGPISIRKMPLGAVRPLERKEVQAISRVIGRT